MTDQEIADRYYSDTGTDPVALEPIEEPLAAVQEAKADREDAKEEIARIKGKIERAESFLEERKAQQQDAAEVGVELSGVEEDVRALEDSLEDYREALRGAQEEQEDATRRLKEAQGALTKRVRSGFEDVREEALGRIRELCQFLQEIRYLNEVALATDAGVPKVRGWRDRLNEIVQRLNDDDSTGIKFEVPRELPDGARALRNRLK